MRKNEILDREDLIEDTLATYEEELSEHSNGELLGEDRLEELRQKQIEALTETYSEQLEDRHDEELFGDQALDAMRDNVITERLKQERQRLESMTDDELVENGGTGYVVAEPEIASAKITELFDKWQTRMRDKRQLVTHPTYGTTREITPLQFAVYETALKAVYVHQFIGNMLAGRAAETLGVYAYHQQIGEGNDIAMPFIKDGECTQDKCNEAAQDYDTCSDWLGKAGLYYELLD